ncbi:protein precursor [Annulohypoxylon bovei var. microspora]|nr:protein precursor [Annulohypoxylon bovei var. microspora]
MGYLLYSITFAALVVGTIIYLTRSYWISIFRRNHAYSRLAGSFAGDIEAGLSSNTFDLGANVSGGDGRAGLDDDAKAQILAIMKKRRMPFDEARRVYMEQRFSANGIGADGRPKDPKFVSFS